MEEKKINNAETAAQNPTLQKKRERREAKAARKAANMQEDKKARPNNILLGILIFGLLIGMFVFISAYNYFNKPADLESYIEENGGSDVYGNFQMDTYTTAAITAKGNSMDIDMKAVIEESDEEAIEDLKEYYGGDDGKKNLENIAASMLLGMKPAVRGFSADAECRMSLNDEELNSVKITYSDAKRIQKEAEKEAREASEGIEIDTDDPDDSDIVVDTDDAEGADAEGTDAEDADADTEADAADADSAEGE